MRHERPFVADGRRVRFLQISRTFAAPDLPRKAIEAAGATLTERMIEIFHRGQRVGLHERRYMGARHGTAPEHMPSAHRRYAAWTPDRFRRWAATIGPHTEGLIVAVLAARRHPEQGFRTCLGLLKLYRGVEAAKAEAVSARALEIGAFNCKSVAALLAAKSRASAARDGVPTTLLDHENLRGPGYYH